MHDTPETHLEYMSTALSLAEQGKLTVSPNPMVGCVIVKAGTIVGTGYHQQAGAPHAEIYALNAAGEAARHATAYVTLEPCCHVGRTPPCTEALIAAGIKEIYVACQDPNPLVAGKGIEALRKAGITVHVGLLENEARQLNKIFFHYMMHQRPYVIAKWAMSLDGKTVTHPSDTRHITSEATQLAAHALRQQVDAVLIGANTAKQDNPELTVRLDTITSPKHPLRIILSAQGELPLSLKLFDISLPGTTLVATTQHSSPTWRDTLARHNIECVLLPQNAQQRIDLLPLLDLLGKRGITSLLIEGGMTIHDSFFSEDLVNETQVYIAPVIIGTHEKKKTLSGETIHVQRYC